MKLIMKRHDGRPKCPDCIIDRDSGIYIEDYFLEVLARERRRTERSRKPFLLALVHIHKAARNNGGGNIVKKIVRMLRASTREIDVKGWYRHDSVIGIIFTEINGINKSLLREKILNGLAGDLSPEHMGSIDVTIHPFPEDCDGRETDEADSRGLFSEERIQKKEGVADADPNLYPELTGKNASKSTARIIKRSIDIGGSLFCIMLFAPFFLIISTVIKMTSKGPVIFRQERTGRLGRKFPFYKFRTMYANCDDTIHREYVRDLICFGKAVEEDGDKYRTYKLVNDPRITPIGKFLRKTSLDEIPQFFNVLRGEMSLVGPRPPIPYELENYELWHRRRVFEVKPGITGIWQIYGRSKTTFDEMVRMDIDYVKKWTPALDIKLLLKTPFAVISGTGAY